MSDLSNIEWTDTTWNPVTGCTKVSPGCAHCYIERTPPFRMAGRKFGRGAIPVQLHPERLEQPLHWRKPRRVFVNSLSDLFHEDVPDFFVLEVWLTMAMACEHTFQILTKRPERMQRLLSGNFAARMRGYDLVGEQRSVGVFAHDFWPLPNVWLGVSVENQHFADERIPLLLQTPAAVRFLSCEPLLGAVDLTRLTRPNRYGRTGDRPGDFEQGIDALNREHIDEMGFGRRLKHGIDWVIVGGESGPGARPMDLAWARSLRDQCGAAGVAFFMKQLGGRKAGSSLDELSEDLRVREFPR